MKKSSTFLKLKEEERAYRRDLILSAAMTLFAKYSFYEIGMRDIAEEAGISPASIYRYFSSRDDILAEILDYEAAKGRQEQIKRISVGNSRLEEIARGIVDFFLERESTLQMVVHFLLDEDIDQKARQKFLTIQQYYLDEFNKFILKLGCIEENVTLFSKAFLATILGIIVNFKNHSEDNQEASYKYIHKLAKLAATVFQNGMPQKKI